MKITVITPRYAISGVPLAQVQFVRALSAAGHDVEFIIGFVHHGYDAPKIDSVNVRILNKQRVIGMLLPLIRYLRENKPDVVFSAEDHLNAVVLIAALVSRSKAKISGASRINALGKYGTYSNVPFTKRWFLKILMRAVMPRANALTCVSKDMVDQYKHVFKSSTHVCVYNIIVDNISLERMREPVAEKWFVEKDRPILITAGILTKRKNISDIILAMKEVTKTRKARLIILGDGEERGELQTLINRLGLEASVKILGYVDNPLKYFSRADIFVLSSSAEGLPNALVEAMMCGCTPVSTNCPTGPREVLLDGRYGYLVPVNDPIALAAGIERAIDHPISENLLRDAIKPFSEHDVIKRHFDVLGIGVRN